MDGLTYWKDLISLALRFLQDHDDNAQAVAVIKKSTLAIELNSHDNWNGGIDYWDILFLLKYRDYKGIVDQKDELETVLYNALSEFHTYDQDVIANVLIRPIIERIIDWRSILPVTKETTIQLIEAEQQLLVDIATGKSYKGVGVEDEYEKRHQVICALASKAGFEYPVSCNTLAEWWLQIKDVGGYKDRRVFISQMFSPLLSLLRESDDTSEVNFSRIASRSGAVQKAIDDANAFMREGKYDSALDRVHTAFHGYLRQLLDEHNIEYCPDDGLPTLFSKLHTCYENYIQPADVGSRIKAILRSAGGMINAVNELRNNNTLAHPNGSLILKREAQLVIKLANAIVDYIEDVEETTS